MACHANDNENLIIELKTTSRDQLIDVSRVIANAFELEFLTNSKHIPHVVMSGSRDGGKSMMIEAMMKTLLDEYDPEDMKHPDAPKRMFIENYSSEAIDRYCQAIGHISGVPAMLGFDRITNGFGWCAHKKLVHAFRRAAKSKGFINPVGAIFSLDSNVARNANPWILIDLRSSRNWNRTLKIEVVNDNLKSSPYSRIYWSALQDFKKNGKLPERFLSGKSIPVKDLFSKYNNADEMKANENLHHDHTQMLKFIYWNHNALGLRKEQFAGIVGMMSDLGEGKKVDDFRDWLKSRGDNHFLSQISASQSKLKKLFFQYAAPDHFYFDFENFIERTKDIVDIKCAGNKKRNLFHLGQGAQHERKMMRSIIPRFMQD